MYSPKERPFGDDLQHLLQGRFEDFTRGDVGLGIKVPVGVGERLNLLLGCVFGDDIEDLPPVQVRYVRAGYGQRIVERMEERCGRTPFVLTIAFPPLATIWAAVAPPIEPRPPVITKAVCDAR
jgi:hypothetical protein